MRGGALHPQLAFLTGGAEPPSVIAKAFARMAGVFLRQVRNIVCTPGLCCASLWLVSGFPLKLMLTLLTGTREHTHTHTPTFIALALQNRATRAVNALILSLKSKHNSDVQQRLQQVTQLVASVSAPSFAL